MAINRNKELGIAIGTEFYQRLAAILNPEKIPGDFLIIEDNIEDFLEKFFITDVLIQKTVGGGSGYNYFKIITADEVAFPLVDLKD